MKARRVPWTPHEDRYFNENNQLLLIRRDDGYWERCIYDEKGRYTGAINSDGDWSMYRYNEQDNITFHETSDGYYYYRDFDEQGRIISYKDSLGLSVKYEYDQFGRRTETGEFKDGRWYRLMKDENDSDIKREDGYIENGVVEVVYVQHYKEEGYVEHELVGSISGLLSKATERAEEHNANLPTHEALKTPERLIDM